MESLSPLAIYVHWPWCKAKCPYCDFNSHAGDIREADYINALLQELRGWQAGRSLQGRVITPFTPTTRRIESIFMGGGTPSLMAPGNIEKIIATCADLGLVDQHTEISVECNPTSFDGGRNATDFFAYLKSAGVNRVSIGIQGLKPEWLSFLGRTHQVSDALATLDAAQRIFDNVNADVIYGLPNQDIRDWEQQLKTLAGRGLSHISAYQLTIEKNTHFYTDVRNGLWKPISGDAEADFFDATRALLMAAGYENYEISNFAMPGRACRHNVHVWRYGDYLGVGAGAHGRVSDDSGCVVATQVIRQPEGYLRRMKDLGDGISVATALDSAEAAQEAVFSGLRLAEGVHLESALKRFGEPSYKAAVSAQETAFLIDAGMLEEVQGYLRLTSMGWPRLNGILERILTRLPKASPPSPTLGMSDVAAYSQRPTVTIL